MKNAAFRKIMAGMCAAAMCAAVMAVSPAVAFAEGETETILDSTTAGGETEVEAEVIANMNVPTYEVVIPKKIDFRQIQQPTTDAEKYATADVTVRCERAENLASGEVIAVFVKDSTATNEKDPFKLSNNIGGELQYEMIDAKGKNIQDSSWFAEGYLFSSFTGGGQTATDTMRLNVAQLYGKDLATWGGVYTGTLNFYTRVSDIGNIQ